MVTRRDKMLTVNLHDVTNIDVRAGDSFGPYVAVSFCHDTEEVSIFFTKLSEIQAFIDAANNALDEAEKAGLRHA